MHIPQIELISGIMRILDRKFGVKNTFPRQTNAIIEAANIIVAAFADDYRAITEGMGIPSWLQSDEVGLSSRFMAFVLGPFVGVQVSGDSYTHEKNYPHDPADFHRCVGLLKAEPRLREHIGKMAEHGKEWKALAEHWSELETLLNEELPTGKAPKMLARMRELLQS